MSSLPVALVQGRGVPYEVALDWQRATAEALRQGSDGVSGTEAIALIEHAPVYTMGRRGGHASLRVPEAELAAELVDIERGGDLTWHGPGQLVGYPILDLRARGLRAADYVRLLEATLIEVLARFGVQAGMVAGRPGVWVGDAKVAAIGVAIRGGVSMHGFALNVTPDLGWFDPIVPCGIADATVTSIAQLLTEPPSMDRVIEVTREVIEARLGVSLVPVESPFGAAVSA